jgi:hypothetical protein
LGRGGGEAIVFQEMERADGAVEIAVGGGEIAGGRARGLWTLQISTAAWVWGFMERKWRRHNRVCGRSGRILVCVGGDGSGGVAAGLLVGLADGVLHVFGDVGEGRRGEAVERYFAA